jgi:hypothetical protein
MLIPVFVLEGPIYKRNAVVDVSWNAVVDVSWNGMLAIACLLILHGRQGNLDCSAPSS